MQFRIVGYSRSTGEGMDIVIQAPNLTWAQYIARQRGIVVDSIDPVGKPRAADRPARAAPPAAPVQGGGPPPSAQTPQETPAEGQSEPAAEPIDLAQELPLEPLPADDQTALEAPPPLAPAQKRSPIRMPSIPKPLVLGLVALVVLAAAAWAVWTFVLGGGAGAMKGHLAFVPPGADTIVFMNLADLRKTDFYTDMRPTIERSARGGGASAIGPDQVDSVFIASSSSTAQPGAVVVTTSGEKSLADIVPGGEARTIEGFNCAASADGHQHAAMLDKRRFLICPDADTLRRLLQQYKDGSAISLSADMERAMRLAGTGHITFVSSARVRDDMPFGAVGAALSMGDTISARFIMLARTPADAAKFVNDLNEAKTQSRSGAGSGLPMMAAAAQVLQGLQASASDNVVKIRGQWKYADVRIAVQQMASLMDFSRPTIPAAPPPPVRQPSQIQGRPPLPDRPVSPRPPQPPPSRPAAPRGPLRP